MLLIDGASISELPKVMKQPQTDFKLHGCARSQESNSPGVPVEYGRVDSIQTQEIARTG